MQDFTLTPEEVAALSPPTRVPEKTRLAIEAKGARVVGGAYQNAYTLLVVSCATSGCLALFRRSAKVMIKQPYIKCFVCGVAELKRKQTFTAEFVAADLTERGLEAIDPFVNTQTSMHFRCLPREGCEGGVEFKTTYNLIRQRDTRTCPKCSRRRVGNQMRLTLVEVHARFRAAGAEPLFDVYPGNDVPLPYSCAVEGCDNVHQMSVSELGTGHQKPLCKMHSQMDRPRGPTHGNWNPNITDAERSAGRPDTVKAWGRFVLQLHDFTCAVSGRRGHKLHAHHLNSWAVHPEQRYRVDNAAPLEEELHKQYHREHFLATEDTFAEFCERETGHSWVNPLRAAKLEVEVVDASATQGGLVSLKVAAHERGLNYVPLFTWELGSRGAIIASRLRHAAGRSRRLAARKLGLVTVDSDRARSFMQSNHAQGWLSSVSASYGLVHEDELVAVLSAGRRQISGRGDEPEWELMRFAAASGASIAGGASRLFRRFIEDHRPTTVTSYADLRFSSWDPAETVYSQLGFIHRHRSQPNYWYVRSGEVHARQKFQKHKLAELLPDFDPALSERVNMEQAGYQRFYDCGNHVFRWTE